MSDMKKTIFITGASSGLGKATAKYFAAKGWNVIATMLAPEKETELTSIPNVRLLRLDVTKDEEVANAVLSKQTPCAAHKKSPPSAGGLCKVLGGT
jgi:NAD(P)-dependent dehydrogenase (short-subunit alcohol dehydrogenase family)